MSNILTADWYPYGKNGYLRKVEVYKMSWQNVLCKNDIIIASKCGGPIALIKDRAQCSLGDHKNMSKPVVIIIYSSSGCFISSFLWNSGQLVKIGWSSLEELLCIQENGEVLTYDMFGKYISTFRMGREVEDTRVIDAQVFQTTTGGTGICILTSTYRLFFKNSVKEPGVRQFSDIPGLSSIPDSWSIVCTERQTFVLFSKSSELYYLSESHNIYNTEDEKKSTITDIAVSPCYDHVALYNNHKKLWIGSSDLRKNYRLYDLHDLGKPFQLAWCGSEAVIGYWEGSVVIIGRDEDVVSYIYDVPVKLVSEIDCVRVISSYSSDIIQTVPKVILEIYCLNSTSPGSYLLEASKLFSKKNYRANEYIHLVRSQLVEAVNQCVEASSHEFNADKQKMLIKAAKFGKTFLVDFKPENYVYMCRVLRVLNAVRNAQIGIFLTFPQFEHLSLKNLLDRLMLRRYYYLAIQIANYMRLNNNDGSSRILEHWAFYKISQLSVDKEQIAKEISEKIGYSSGVSYIDIAEKARTYGRIELAVKLIDYEPNAAKQINILLSLGNYTRALEKAIQSYNSDLINIVIIEMQRKMGVKDLQLEIRKDSVVYALYKIFCREQNKEILFNIYDQEDDNNEIAAYHLRNAYNPENFSMKATLLERAKEHYKNAKNETNMILCDEQKKLLSMQKNLEDKFKKEFVDLSLQDTIHRLLIEKEIKIVDELRSLFRVSERKYWWLKIKSLAELGEWSELELLSKTKKSPIGFEPFIDICLKYNKNSEASKYMVKIKEENKVKYLVKLKKYSEAIKNAEMLHDVNALEYIRLNCDQKSLPEVNAALARLT